MSVQTSTTRQHWRHKPRVILNDCAVCDSKAIGINFGVPSCGPCKAFFRRNARRKDILKYPCQIGNVSSFINENKDLSNKNFYTCSDVRQCTSCRLRRCYNVGMKEELIRSIEENKRFRQLIETNRQQRKEIFKLKYNNLLRISQLNISTNKLLDEVDWRLLSNIVHAYDNYCLQNFIKNRQNIFYNQTEFFDQTLIKIKHYETIHINIMTSFISFLSSIPIIQSLLRYNRLYLCIHNVRSLIFPNLHEIEQTCFTDSSQTYVDNISAEYIYGKRLFNESIQMKQKSGLLVISDSVVTRLWLIILFLSTPLHCYFDPTLPYLSYKNRLIINKIQNSFINLLWNYLLHRHEYLNAIRIFSNLIRIYLQMQKISQEINYRIRTQIDLVEMNQAFNRALLSDKDILYNKKN